MEIRDRNIKNSWVREEKVVCVTTAYTNCLG